MATGAVQLALLSLLLSAATALSTLMRTGMTLTLISILERLNCAMARTMTATLLLTRRAHATVTKTDSGTLRSHLSALTRLTYLTLLTSWLLQTLLIFQCLSLGPERLLLPLHKLTAALAKCLSCSR